MSTELATTGGNLPDQIKFAEALSASNLLPKQYSRQPANILMAMQLGDALGIPAIQAITGIHVVEGKPSASADLIASMVRKAGHKLRITETKDASGPVVVAQLIRSDDPDFTFEARWDMAKAKAANLTGKGVWKSYPGQMLRARAITEVCRQGASDALYGVVYSAEELGADESANVTLTQVPTEPTNAPQAPPSPAQDTPSRDWVAEMERATTRDELKAIFDAGLPKSLWGVMKEHKDRIEQAAAAEVVQEQLGAEAIVDADIVEEQA